MSTLINNWAIGLVSGASDNAPPHLHAHPINGAPFRDLGIIVELDIKNSKITTEDGVVHALGSVNHQFRKWCGMTQSPPNEEFRASDLDTAPNSPDDLPSFFKIGDGAGRPLGSQVPVDLKNTGILYLCGPGPDIADNWSIQNDGLPTERRLHVHSEDGAVRDLGVIVKVEFYERGVIVKVDNGKVTPYQLGAINPLFKKTHSNEPLIRKIIANPEPNSSKPLREKIDNWTISPNSLDPEEKTFRLFIYPGGTSTRDLGVIVDLDFKNREITTDENLPLGKRSLWTLGTINSAFRKHILQINDALSKQIIESGFDTSDEGPF